MLKWAMRYSLAWFVMGLARDLPDKCYICSNYD